VTNKGVGGLLKKWGEGASLIRKEWKTREENGKGGVLDMNHRDNKMAVDDDEDDDDNDEEEDGDEEEEEEEEEEEPDLEATPRMLPRRTIGVQSPQLSSDTRDRDTDGRNNELTNLTESLNSLSIVPSSIRFGRGGKSGGFIPRGQGRGRHGRGRGRGVFPRSKHVNSVTVTGQ
jgi:hypothetical protein